MTTLHAPESLDLAALQVSRLVEHCQQTLGSRQQWASPPGYPGSLALCVLDAVWSIGVRYRSVENVLDRYRALRRAEGAEPAQEGAGDLARVIEQVGGADAFAHAVGNRQLTSTRGGVLKASAVLNACLALTAPDVGVTTAAELRQADGERLVAAERAWRAVRGQRSGISWRYFLLLSGRQEVKADRMVVGFVQQALGRRPSLDEAAALVTAAAPLLGVDVRTLDHRVWRYQSGRG